MYFWLLTLFAVKALRKKWAISVLEFKKTKDAYNELTEALDDNSRQQWEEEEEEALAEGGDALSVYGVRLKEGQLYSFLHLPSYKLIHTCWVLCMQLLPLQRFVLRLQKKNKHLVLNQAPHLGLQRVFTSRSFSKFYFFSPFLLFVLI